LLKKAKKHKEEIGQKKKFHEDTVVENLFLWSNPKKKEIIHYHNYAYEKNKNKNTKLHLTFSLIL